VDQIRSALVSVEHFIVAQDEGEVPPGWMHWETLCVGVELSLRDTERSPVPRDRSSLGEICARSNVVFASYWNQPEETDRAIRDGWFHTGDLDAWDEVGSIHIADRKKDVIISGGKNISSPEIEDTLYKHPGVLECAVIGIPTRSGERRRARSSSPATGTNSTQRALSISAASISRTSSARPGWSWWRRCRGRRRASSGSSGCGRAPWEGSGERRVN
jgi:acyl-CoA synthetase (AMP-forming)/AMP-acid ligase II